MSIKQVTIKNETYNIGQVKAEIQADMLDDLGFLCITSFRTVNKEEISAQDLSDALLCYAAEKKEVSKRLRSNALLKTFKHGTEIPVTIADFGGNIDSYNLLAAQAIMENLSDFFMRLETERQERLKTQGVKKTSTE